MADIMTGRFGRFPTAPEITAWAQGAEPGQRPRIEALAAVAAAERTVAATAARRACLRMGRADVRPFLGTGKLDAKQLDVLPFGIIGLDPGDKVRLYNRWEARLSRLAPDAVLGHHWFRDVALCTRVDAFEDRYRVFAADPAPETTDTFEFSFDFPHGRQHVGIVFLRGYTVGLNLIAVTRGSAGFKRNTRILLRLLSLAMASGDHDRFALQIRSWYLDYLSSIGVAPREIYLIMGELGDLLPSHLEPPVVGALRRPLRVAMGIVEDAMLNATGLTHQAGPGVPAGEADPDDASIEPAAATRPEAP